MFNKVQERVVSVWCIALCTICSGSESMNLSTATAIELYQYGQHEQCSAKNDSELEYNRYYTTGWIVTTQTRGLQN